MFAQRFWEIGIASIARGVQFEGDLQHIFVATLALKYPVRETCNLECDNKQRR